MRLIIVAVLFVAGIVTIARTVSEYWIPVTTRASLACDADECYLTFDRLPKDGPHDELKASGFYGDGVLLDRVLSYGSEGEIVYGKALADDGQHWFVLDGRNVETAMPLTYSTEESWITAIKQLGVGSIRLREPSLLDADWRAFDLFLPALLGIALLLVVFSALRARTRGLGARTE